MLFEWDDANLRHIARHRVKPEEAQRVLRNDPMLRQFQAVEGEDRWESLGRTDSGRILAVWWTVRGERIRVVTAFEPARRLKRLYLQTMDKR